MSRKKQKSTKNIKFCCGKLVEKFCSCFMTIGVVFYKIMKKSLFGIFIFLIVILLGTFLGSVFYMLYGNLTSIVASHTESFLSFKLFIPGLIISFPLVCILSLLFLLMLEIRHPSKSIFPKMTYFVLGFLTWSVLMPFNMHNSLKYIERQYDVEFASEHLTDGLFRKTPEGIEYLSRVSDKGLGTGILIDEEGQINYFFDKDVKIPVENLFADSLIKDGASLSVFVSVPLNIYSELMVNGTFCWVKGFVSWFSFAFFGFALISLYELRNLSSWKLLNMFLILFVAILITLLNYVYYCGDFFNSFAVEWARVFADLPIDNPLMVTMNIVIIGICVALGFLKKVINKNKFVEDEDELE